MKTITFPRRTMRPPVADPKRVIPATCAWCRNPIGRGEVFTVGHDLGKVVSVCGSCLTPPLACERLLELTVEED